jgi:hypothetical protein
LGITGDHYLEALYTFTDISNEYEG